MALVPQQPPTAEVSPDAREANLVGAAILGLHDALEQGLEDDGLDVRAATALLSLLDLLPAGSVRRLSQVIGLTHSGAVRLADRLEAGGYVRRATAADRRSVALLLTPSGRSLALRARRLRRDLAGVALDSCTGVERQQVVGACERIIAQLVAQRMAIRARGGVPVGGALCRMCDLAACGRAQGHCPAQQAAAQRANDLAAAGPQGAGRPRQRRSPP